MSVESDQQPEDMRVLAPGLKVHVSGLGGNEIARYAMGALRCRTCKSEAGSWCVRVEMPRVCPERFKAAVTDLDDGAIQATYNRLNDILMRDLKKHTMPMPQCKACGLHGADPTDDQYQAHRKSIIQQQEES